MEGGFSLVLNITSLRDVHSIFRSRELKDHIVKLLHLLLLHGFSKESRFKCSVFMVLIRL